MNQLSMYSMYGEYETPLFIEMWGTMDNTLEEKIELFKAQWHESGFDMNEIGDADLNRIFLLLYAKYGNNPIAPHSELRFKYDLYGIIFKHGPNWAQKLKIQNWLRTNPEGIAEASLHITNTGSHPTTETTGDMTPQMHIGTQSVSGKKKSQLEIYTTVLSLLDDDFTDDFINRFSHLFNPWTAPQPAFRYYTEEN